MHRMTGGVRSADCPECPGVEETTEHFLLICPAGKKDRTCYNKEIQKACTCKEGSCHGFAKRLDSEGLQTFLLGGPVDGRTIEPEVDAKALELISKLWARRKATLTQAMEVPTQPAVASRHWPGDQPTMQNLFARQLHVAAQMPVRRPVRRPAHRLNSRGERAGMDSTESDWSSDETVDLREVEVPSSPSSLPELSTSEPSDVEVGPESGIDYQPDTVTRNWAKHYQPINREHLIIPPPTEPNVTTYRRPNRVVTRSMTESQQSLGLEAHVDIDMPSI
jgi:hypothetical protein